MSQSSLLVALLAAAFLLYVAANGRLQTYAGVLWGAKKDGGGSGGSGGGGKTADTVKTAVTIGEHVLPFVMA